MSILEDRVDWKLNPWYTEHGPEHSDYTGFYVGITICTFLGLSIIVLNIVFCCCSQYREYWKDPGTGNRVALPLWIQSPKNNPPLTLLPELNNIERPDTVIEYSEEY